jgi:hypothetical protein
MDDQLFQMMTEDMKEMKKDIKTLLAFKYQIIGGSFIVSLIASVVFQIIISIINK